MRTRKPVPVHNLKVTRNGKIKKRGILWRMRRVLYLVALISTVGAAGLVYVLGQIELPVDPRVMTTQKQTSFICAADVQVNCNAANAMAQLHGSEDRVLVTWDQIPPVLWQAVVSAEDRDFFRHGGVDPLGIARAAYQDIKGSASRQGGSTITQQYVKQEYLSAEQTVTRKIKEAVMAVKLEQKISKEEILTRYLNTVYFGRGAYGVQAASRTWFGHDVEALNAGEAAFLAGLLRNPTGADPYRGPESLKEAERRRRVVLAAMQEEGYLTEAQVQTYLAVPMDPADPKVSGPDRFIVPPPTPSTLGAHVKGQEFGSKYFAEYVRRWLVAKYGSETVLGGGLRVYTTLDLKLQKLAYDTVTTTMNRDGDPKASIVSLDDRGHILSMMAGTDFDHDQTNLVTGAGGGGRQPGSTFKVFALAEAVREGYSIESVVPAPTKASFGPPECREKWEPKGGPGSNLSLVSATKNSVNTAYAELMVRLGPEKVASMAEAMGVGSLRSQRPECSWVLGTAQVNPLEMAASFSVIADRGIYREPIPVSRVEFPDGRVDNFAGDGTRVLTTEQADRIRYTLEQVIDGGTGRAANIGRPAAGKTGTTQRNVDAWFIGFTPNITTAVWMGYPQGSIPMKNVHGIQVQGGTFPAEMWQAYMSRAVADTPALEFPTVEASVLRAGEILDPAFGRTRVVATGDTSGDNGGVPSATTRPKPPRTATTTPGTSTPSGGGVTTTAPPVSSTTPVTRPTVPVTTGPPAGGGGD